jgi:hypothetical protein
MDLPFLRTSCRVPLISSFVLWFIRFLPMLHRGGVMENFADLMQRLLEIQHQGRQRSPKLIAEDKQLMNDLQKRNLTGNPTQTVRLSQDSSERERFKV